MKVKIKLSKEWNGKPAGTVLEVDAETAKEIIAAGAGAKVDDEMAGKGMDAEAVAKVAAEAATKAVGELLKQAKGDTKGVYLAMHDKSDDDPTLGYLPGNTKSAEKLSKGEVYFAFGKFAKDVHASGNGKGETELLRKCRERSDEMVRKAAGDGMVVSSDADGGYLIFSAASQMMQAAALEQSIVRPRARKLTLATQVLNVPYMRDTTHSSGTVFGGIQIYFDDELAQYTSSKPQLAKLEFKLKKMTALGFVSDEWIKWSPVSMGSWLIPAFGEAMGWKEDLCFLNGPGGAQPLGILNSKAAITVTAESGQTADTFVLENSTNMMARLRRLSNNLAWVMSQDVFPQLPKFNIAVGTGGAPVFVNNASAAAPQSLWGLPIIWTEKVPALGSSGCVLLTDFNDYIVADDQSGPAIAESQHLKFDYGQSCFRITKYIDGQNATESTFTPANGSSNTLSPVVKLNT